MAAQSVSETGITGVFFDLVGTLIRSRAAIGEQYAEVARRFGADAADATRLGTAFRQAMAEAPPMAFPGRSLAETAAAERVWWERLVRRVVAEAGLGGVLSGERFERFFTDLFDHFTTEEAWEPYPDALPVLAALQAEGVVLGLITNYDTRVYPVLDAVGLTPFFDSVTIPALAGAAKPDPAIFLHALRTHHLDPAEAAYVGDEPGDDYAGATAAGLRAILLDRKDRHKDAAVRRIRSLEELRPAAPPLARAPRTRRPR